MLTVTDAAAARCADKLDNVGAKEGQCVRLVLDGGRPALKRGRAREGEAVFKHDRRVVLVVSQDAATRLSDRTLGCRQTPSGPRLKLTSTPTSRAD